MSATAPTPESVRDSGLVEVALPLPVFQPFTYRIRGAAPPAGTRVRVPFGREERTGWVLGPASGEAPARVKDVLAVLDQEPTFSAELLRVCAWMAEYYVAPPGIALRAAAPAVLIDASHDFLALKAPVPPEATLSGRERKLVGALAARPGPHRVATLRRQLAMGSLWPEVRSLSARGALAHETLPPREPAAHTRKVVLIKSWLSDLAERERVLGRARRQREALQVLEAAGGKLPLARLMEGHGFSRAVVAGLESRGLVELAEEEVARDPFGGGVVAPPARLSPTPDQARAVAALVSALDDPERRPFLLHGVTASGKTLVYIELLRRVLERGGSAIVLVPEISLTPQTVSRFRAHFGDRVAVLHSRLSDGERYDAWRALRSGEKRIAVGARSALFAPLARLRAIIVDEEHEGSYKQSEAPRYHGRDLAVVRAEIAGAVCVLGSATPSLESWANHLKGKFVRLSLPDRVGGARLPAVRLVDLREARKQSAAGRDGAGEARPGRAEGGVVLSDPLVDGVRARLAASEQVILLLNRRGYSSFVQCRECGDVRACVHCSVSLTFHRTKRRLLCHHCRHEESAPERCRRCGSRDLALRGVGTEQVERVVAATFPGARIARMDVDTTSGKWSHHEILGRVERGEVDILLGTQMIAKGLDFPRVTLVGVVNADVGMHMPDFRACERTFQLLSQVSGRAGRGALGGEVVVQTSLPEHYAIQAALRHDYVGFATKELEERAGPRYPPHVRLANVVLSSPDPEAVAAAADAGASWARGWAERGRAFVEVVGPAPAPIERLHGRWRWHFLLRAGSAHDLGAAARALMLGFRPRGADVRLALDRDPVALL